MHFWSSHGLALATKFLFGQSPGMAALYAPQRSTNSAAVVHGVSYLLPPIFLRKRVQAFQGGIDLAKLVTSLSTIGLHSNLPCSG